VTMRADGVLLPFWLITFAVHEPIVARVTAISLPRFHFLLANIIVVTAGNNGNVDPL
jgi:hypothetical protein